MTTRPNNDIQQLLFEQSLRAYEPVGGYYHVHSADGAFRFSLPQDASLRDAAAILAHGAMELMRGEAIGRAAVKRELLALIGAAPATEAEILSLYGAAGVNYPALEPQA